MSLPPIQPTRLCWPWLDAQFILGSVGQHLSSPCHPRAALISLLLSEEHFLLAKPDVLSFSSKNTVTE
jgi:hypothetical protein